MNKDLTRAEWKLIIINAVSDSLNPSNSPRSELVSLRAFIKKHANDLPGALVEAFADVALTIQNASNEYVALFCSLLEVRQLSLPQRLVVALNASLAYPSVQANPVIRGEIVRLMFFHGAAPRGATVLNDEEMSAGAPWLWIDIVSTFNMAAAVEAISREVRNAPEHAVPNLLVRLPTFWTRWSAKLIPSLQEWSRLASLSRQVNEFCLDNGIDLNVQAEPTQNVPLPASANDDAWKSELTDNLVLDYA